MPQGWEYPSLGFPSILEIKGDSSVWNENIQFLQMLMAMAILTRFAYELKQPPKAKSISILPKTRSVRETARPSDITSQQKEWAEKAVRRYAEAQEKKWHRWSDSMFEPTK
jgi:hypothetical protein